MNIHRKLILLVGLGMLLVLTITVFSLVNITTLFSQMTKAGARISLEVREIWHVEQKIEDAARMLHEYERTGDERFRRNHEMFIGAAIMILNEMAPADLGKDEVRVIGSLVNDLNTIAQKAEQVFVLDLGEERSRKKARELVEEIDGLVVWLKHDLETYRDESGVQLDAVVSDLAMTRKRISILFGVVLSAAVAFLLFFGIYLHRRVAVPIRQLWEGAQAISRGDLDHRVRLSGERDIATLAIRFNDMAGKLKESYADLERRLLERTQQLGALNSVSLTLGTSAVLREMLQRSLRTVLDNFTEMEARGGIFLCEPDGEFLRLVSYHGLSLEFARREERIRMGECLCGAVARTGEMIYSEAGCMDPRHTRSDGHDHAHIIVPLKARGAVLGVMFLYPTKQFSLKPSDIQMFDTIGAQLGMAVENLRLYGEVKEAGMKFWDLFENSRDILFTLDLEGTLTAVNKAMEQFSGLDKAALIGRNVTEFFAEEGRLQMKRILSGELPLADRIYEFDVTKQDGTRAIIQISGRSLFQKSRPTGFHLAARDVTEQKNLREMLVQAERLAAIGQVGIAMRHEINNPLTTVIGNTELLLERYESGGSDLKKRLELILENSIRIAEILKRLQDIKRDRTVDYMQGVKMTDLGPEQQERKQP